MIINSTTDNSFASILFTPSYVIPSLSDKEILTITVDAIRSYVAGKIDFQTLVDITTNIKLFSGMRKNTNEALNNALVRTSLLSKNNGGKNENLKASLNELVSTLLNQ